MTGRRQIRLVAEREVKERLRTRSFQVSTAIAVLITVGAIVLPRLTSNPLDSTVRIGVVGQSARQITMELEQARVGTNEAKLEYRSFPSLPAARDALKRGRVQVVVSQDEVYLKEPLDPNDVSPKIRVAKVLALLPAVSRAPLPIGSVFAHELHRHRSPLPAMYGTILIYIFTFMYGSTILSGVAEEKGSRVIEVLLSAVPAKRLLAGKVLGIGVVALLQGLVIAVSAVVGYVAVGTSPFAGATGGEVFQIFGWFLLAYAFYACVYAAVGATISRQEEAQSVMFPVSLPILIAYATAFASLVGGESSRLVTVLSFLPPTSAIAMPVRIALGTASAFQVAIAVGLTILSTGAVIVLAGRMYTNSILRIGSRVRIRDALRVSDRTKDRTPVLVLGNSRADGSGVTVKSTVPTT